MVHSSDCRRRIFGKDPGPLYGLVMPFNEGVCTLVVVARSGALFGELSCTTNEDLDPCANQIRNARVEETTTNSLSSTSILPMIFIMLESNRNHSQSFKGSLGRNTFDEYYLALEFYLIAQSHPTYLRI